MSTKRPWRAYGRYGSVGIELVLSILIGVLGGRWLDNRFAGGHGWLTIAGLVAGFYAGLRQLFRAAKQIQRDTEREDREEAEARAAFAERAMRDANAKRLDELAPDEGSSKTVPGDDGGGDEKR